MFTKNIKMTLVMVTKYLVTYHQAGFLGKLKLICLISFPMSIITGISQSIRTWSVTNQEYISLVLLCIAIDHIIGTIVHAFKLKDFSIQSNIIGITKKIFLCALAGILFEAVHYTLKEVPLIYEYLKSVTRLIVVLYPAGNAFINMSILTNGKFPPFGWIKKIQAFNTNLDLEKFKKADDISLQ